MLDSLTRDDLPDSVMDIVDSIGLDAFKELVRLAGVVICIFLMRVVLLSLLEIRRLGKFLMGIIRLFLGSLVLVKLRLEILLIISKWFLNGEFLLIDASHKLFVLG